MKVEALEGALDRFARFFIEPLLTQEQSEATRGMLGELHCNLEKWTLQGKAGGQIREVKLAL